MWRRKSKKLAGKGSTLISTGKGIKKDTSATVTAVTPTSGHQPATAKISSGGKTVKSGSTPAALSMEDAPLSPVKVKLFLLPLSVSELCMCTCCFAANMSQNISTPEIIASCFYRVLA